MNESASELDYGATNSSTRHVLEAMRLICQSDEPIDLADLTRGMGLPTSTAHRALITLEKSGFTRRIPSAAKFVAGDIIHHLIRSMVAQFPLRFLVIDKMRAMSRKLDATVSLNQRVESLSLRLASVEGSRESYQLRRVGETRALHQGIGPQAILVALPNAQFEHYLDQPPASGGETFDAKAMRDLRKGFRKQGFLRRVATATSPLEWISVPLKGDQRDTIASLSVGIGDGTAVQGASLDKILSGIADIQSLMDAHPEQTVSPFP